MAERPIVLEGANPVLASALVLLGLAAMLLWVGPGMIAVERARDSVDQKEERFAEWDAERESAESTTPGERRSWSAQFDTARNFGVVASDDASLAARIARRLAAPSVRGLEVSPESSRNDDEEGEALRFTQPYGETTLEFRRVPVRVRFDAGYADVKAILERLAPGGGTGMRVRRVDLKRQFPRVRVDLELDVWTRREASS